MKKRMLGTAVLILLFIAAFLVYSLIKVRVTPSVTAPMNESIRRSGVQKLYDHVHHLSVRIGSRSLNEYDKIEAAKTYILTQLSTFDQESVLQSYRLDDGKQYSNIIVTKKGATYPDETIIIGAHYDTIYGTPGADDNASAVAILLEICRALKDFQPERTLKLVFFVLEEPPIFRTDSMGSSVYARDAKEKGEKIRAMISLEMLGYFSDRENGQSFPFPLMSLMYPTTPNFVAVVGNLSSARLVSRVAKTLKKGCDVPVESLSAVSLVPGIDFSDHYPFWQMGYPGLMITDTAFYRNPNYHTDADTIDTLDFDRMSRLLKGLIHVAQELAVSSEQATPQKSPPPP